MGIGAVGGLEPPLGTLPPLGIYRVSSQLLCKECCSLVGCLHCGVIGSPRSPSTCCIVGADHIRNANSHTRLEYLLCATRCGRYACCQYVNVLFVGRMGIEPIRIPYCLTRSRLLLSLSVRSLGEPLQRLCRLRAASPI